VDVAFHHGGVDSQLGAVFDLQPHRGTDESVIDPPNGVGVHAREAALKSISRGHRFRTDPGELPQGVTVGNAAAQLSVRPILDAPQQQSPQHLLPSQAAPAGVRPLEAALEICLNPLAQFGVGIEKIADPAQGRIQLNPLPLEFELGETALGRALPHPVPPPNHPTIFL